MAQTKVNIRALTDFSHGNLDARAGGRYSIAKGEAQELEKHGFVELTADEQPETDPSALLGDDAEEKMEDKHENKAAPKTSNKAK
jgi:hypothetical protein